MSPGSAVGQPDWQPIPCPSLFDIPDNLQTVDDLDGDGLPNEVEEQETNTDPECPDTDEDGLLDPWEVPEGVAGSGFDVNQDGTADVGRDIVFGPYNGECNDSFGLRREPNGQNCGLVFEPDPLHKDVYVEMDWQDCVLGNCPELVGLVVDPSHHAPDMAGLLDVVNVFRDAPVANPDEVDGIDLHILVDEDISHDHNCDQGAAETRPTNFGTPQQRSDPEVLAAKEMTFRYAWSGHSSLKPTPQECPLPSFADIMLAGLALGPLPEYDISPHGYATPGGRDILVTLAVTWICQLFTFDIAPGVGYFPPCYRQVAPAVGIVPGLFPADIAQAGGGTVEVDAPLHVLLGVPPSQGVRQLWSRSFMNLLGQSLGVPGALVGNDANASGTQMPESYGSWAGLVYAPPAPGAPSSVQPASVQPSGDGFVPIFPDLSLAGQDADGDGTAEGIDNCPALVNADQADLDGDGFGDACDVDEDGDGLAGDDDSFPGDTDNDGAANGSDEDDDGDGLPDGGDNRPLAANPGQEDADGDSQGDACDVDDDGDGFPDGLELTMGSDPLDGDSLPEFTGFEDSCSDGEDNDGDGETDGGDDSCLDDDGDTVPDSLDNCPGVVTINLLDSDGDGAGNLCDPAGVERTWGDANCSGAADPVDSLLTLRHDAGLSVNTGACPALGTVVEVQGASPHPWGDVDCSGDVGPVDGLKLLRFDSGLSVAQGPDCPLIGSTVSVSVGAAALPAGRRWGLPAARG